jgi:thiamine-monophosphate kinase
MDLKELGEREAIARVRGLLGTTPDLGVGEDDCAAVPLGDGRLLLVSTDVLVGPTHMLPGTTPGMMGSFAVEVAVSDIAAMGGQPMGVLTALALPPSTEAHWVEGLARGMVEATAGHGITVLGGDTKASGEPTVAMTALGIINEDECLYRRGARPGDKLLLTGPVGGPAVGYELIRSGAEGRERDALHMVYGVRARVAAGLALAASRAVHACIDLSDGLAPSVHQLCEASGCGAVVAWTDLPLPEDLEEAARLSGSKIEEMALNFGGEYELLAAVEPAF